MNKSEAGKLGYNKTKDILQNISKDKHEKAKESYYEKNIVCLFCGTPIPYEKRGNKFCTHSCAASFNNKKVKSKKRLCKCGKIFIGRNRYCGECNLKEIPFEELKTDRTRKIRLLDERPYKCEMCDNTEWLGKPILLILDHINGNSSDNNKENLRLICSNCDSTLPTYKAKNKGNGRTIRRRNAT